VNQFLASRNIHGTFKQTGWRFRQAFFVFVRMSCHKPTSLERPETNTLSVGAHPRDGESVEAKGMPKVK
jgi:hypothetical protein